MLGEVNGQARLPMQLKQGVLQAGGMAFEQQRRADVAVEDGVFTTTKSRRC